MPFAHQDSTAQCCPKHDAREFSAGGPRAWLPPTTLAGAAAQPTQRTCKRAGSQALQSCRGSRRSTRAGPAGARPPGPFEHGNSGRRTTVCPKQDAREFFAGALGGLFSRPSTSCTGPAAASPAAALSPVLDIPQQLLHRPQQLSGGVAQEYRHVAFGYAERLVSWRQGLASSLAWAAGSASSRRSS